MHSIINKNNVLIYDKNQNFINLINHYCGSNIQAVFCKSVTELLDVDLTTISTVYYLVESEDDFKIILKFQNQVDSICIITDLKSREKLSKFNNIFFIDLKSYPHKIIYDFYQKTIEIDKI